MFEHLKTKSFLLTAFCEKKLIKPIRHNENKYISFTSNSVLLWHKNTTALSLFKIFFVNNYSRVALKYRLHHFLSIKFTSLVQLFSQN